MSWLDKKLAGYTSHLLPAPDPKVSHTVTFDPGTIGEKLRDWSTCVTINFKEIDHDNARK